MSANTIEMYKGDTDSITITVTDANGDAFDLSGYTMLLTGKENVSDTAVAIGPVTGVVSSPATGIGNIPITSVHTNIAAGIYYYDIQISNGTTTKTILLDRFIIKQDVTN